VIVIVMSRRLFLGWTGILYRARYPLVGYFIRQGVNETMYICLRNEIGAVIYIACTIWW
jgi:hypothetical protein